MAMLTAPVNIAVFAAFYTVIGNTSRTNVEFKPVCAIWQVDIWRYGRQKRHETARGMARSGKGDGKNGKGDGKNGKDVG